MKDLIRTKGKVVTLKVAKVFEEFKEKLMEKGEKYVTKEMADEALADLEEDDEIVRTGGIIRILNA